MSAEKEKPFGEANQLYSPGLAALEDWNRRRAGRGLRLGGLKAVASQAFRLVDQLEAIASVSNAKDRLAILRAKGDALKTALAACQEKRDILRDRKNKYKKPPIVKQQRPQDALIAARQRMADRAKGNN